MKKIQLKDIYKNNERYLQARNCLNRYVNYDSDNLIIFEGDNISRIIDGEIFYLGLSYYENLVKKGEFQSIEEAIALGEDEYLISSDQDFWYLFRCLIGADIDLDKVSVNEIFRSGANGDCIVFGLTSSEYRGNIVICIEPFFEGAFWIENWVYRSENRDIELYKNDSLSIRDAFEKSLSIEDVHTYDVIKWARDNGECPDYIDLPIFESIEEQYNNSRNV